MLTIEPKRRGARTAAIGLALAGALVASLCAAAPASAFVQPREPDRAVSPIIAGTKVNTPTGSCTVGAVLIPRSFYLRITPYQRALRYIVLARHCAQMYAPIHMGVRAIGNVVQVSQTSDTEIVRVSPIPISRSLQCSAHHSQPALCSPIQSYTPGANGQVFMPSRGQVSRVAVSGFADPDEDRFCTSGWASGVRCVWHVVSMPPRTDLGYEHLAAAVSDEVGNLQPGDSGGPAVSYSHEILGIIHGDLPADPSGAREARTTMLYTPMSQVMSEFNAYALAPAN